MSREGRTAAQSPVHDGNQDARFYNTGLTTNTTRYRFLRCSGCYREVLANNFTDRRENYTQCDTCALDTMEWRALNDLRVQEEGEKEKKKQASARPQARRKKKEKKKKRKRSLWQKSKLK
jgi:hypothetical protein